MPIGRLYVVRDDDTTIVSRHRLRVAGLGLRTSRCGGWEETVSVRQNVLPAPAFGRAAAVVLPPALSAGALWIAGARPEIVVGAGAAVFLAGAYLMPMLARLRPAAKQDGPKEDGRAADAPFRTLFDRPERHRFAQTLDLAKRITDAWPALSGLIDRRETERALNQALWDIADLLSRQQDVRRIAETLQAQSADGTPLADAVSRELGDQVAKARERLRRLELEVASRMAALETVEAAGRRFVREQRLIQTLRETGQFLNTQVAEPPTDAGAELAERTTAVLEAYRELSQDLHRADD
jgi:hypothetical protein